MNSRSSAGNPVVTSLQCLPEEGRPGVAVLLARQFALKPGWRLLCCSLLLPAFLLPTSLLAQESEEERTPDNDYSRLIFEAQLLAPPIFDDGTAAPTVVESMNSAAGSSLPGPLPSQATFPQGPVQQSSAQQSATAAPDSATLARYEDDVSAMIETEGMYSTQLREQYESLGELYQQNNEHEKAIAVFENAMHIDRVNDGLYTLQQIPLVENIIESYNALANYSEVNDHHAYLYYVQQKAFSDGDPRLLAAKENWADWNVESFLKGGVTSTGRFDATGINNSANRMQGPEYIAVQHPTNGTFVYVPRSQLTQILNPSSIATNAAATDLYLRSSNYAVSPEQVIDERLRTARDLYQEIIDSPNAEYADVRGVTVEHKLANIAYAVKQQMDAMENSVQENSLAFNGFSTGNQTNPVVTRGYTKSRESLEAIAQQLDDDATSDPQAVAQAWINLGDWHLGFERSQRGREAYERALVVLAEAGRSPAEISAIFNPAPLIPAPGFALHPYTRPFYGIAPDAPLAYDGFIDMTLTINQAGDVKGSRITGVSSDTPQRLRNVLLDFLRGHSMRPLVQDGKLVKESELSLRIHYSY
ncbi:MAG: hypothetical protein V4603_14365 [Pseudomonadota bacterium]